MKTMVSKLVAQKLKMLKHGHTYWMLKDLVYAFLLAQNDVACKLKRDLLQSQTSTMFLDNDGIAVTNLVIPTQSLTTSLHCFVSLVRFSPTQRLAVSTTLNLDNSTLCASESDDLLVKSEICAHLELLQLKHHTRFKTLKTHVKVKEKECQEYKRQADVKEKQYFVLVD